VRKVGLREQMGLVGASCDEENYRVSEQSTGGEQECLGRRAIQPVRVVDENRERRRFGVPADQTQGRRANCKPIGTSAETERGWVSGGSGPGHDPVGGGAGAEGEGGGQCAALGSWDLVEFTERRAQQLQETAERDLLLRLGPARPEYAQVRGECRRFGQERRLPDPRFPADQQHPTGADTRPRDQLPDHPPLGLPPDQHPRSLPRHLAFTPPPFD
jgi:hypothetical protein